MIKKTTSRTHGEQGMISFHRKNPNFLGKNDFLPDLVYVQTGFNIVTPIIVHPGSPVSID